MDIKMIGITVTVKLQNKLAKNSIMLSLKSISEHLFSETGGLLLRSFTHVSDTQVDLFHVWKDRTFQEKARKSFSTQFWNDIKDMGGIVSFSEGECELELSNFIKFSDAKFK
tara:strand:+ start:227 stop:562 length:336 start_codon:yes stop_codon:yes gene_type:complete